MQEQPSLGQPLAFGSLSQVDCLCCSLNLLIAIMGDSYEKVKESERVEAVRERARIVVHAERCFPKSHRYHRFMHFVSAVDSTGKSEHTAWEGVTRRVTNVVRMRSDRLDDKLSQMKSEMDATMNDQSEMNAKMNAKLAQIENELAHTNRKLDLLLDRSK